MYANLSNDSMFRQAQSLAMIGSTWRHMLFHIVS